MKNAIVTYIYPNALSFIESFTNRINKINTDNIILIIFNDGIENPDIQFKNIKLPYKIISVKGTINEIRHRSIQYLSENFNDVENYIFQDIDDLFSINRFDVLIEKLQNNMMVCNDLKKIDNNGIHSSPMWSERLENDFEFDYQFIINKNIIGLGNVGLKKNILAHKTQLSNTPAAFDWFYFYQVLKDTRIKALFTSECQTYYLQHDNNIAGIDKGLTVENLRKIINVKKKHYESLISLGYSELEQELKKLNNLEDVNLSATKKNQNLFWWEETEIL